MPSCPYQKLQLQPSSTFVTDTQSALDRNEDECDGEEADACGCSIESNRSVSLSEGCLQLQQQIFR